MLWRSRRPRSWMSKFDIEILDAGETDFEVLLDVVGSFVISIE